MKALLTKHKKIIIAVVVLAVVTVAAWYFWPRKASAPAQSDDPLAQGSYTVPPLSVPYTNPTYHFSLMMPAGFTAKESTVDGKDTIVFEDAKDEGIQIVISPYDNVKTLSADDIKAAIPDMAITDAEPVQVGPSNTGVAFKSDNQSFDGASREVWFVFDSNLYQISTYQRFDSLLQAMFGTWNFSVK